MDRQDPPSGEMRKRPSHTNRNRRPRTKRPGLSRRLALRCTLVAGGIWMSFLAVVLGSYFLADLPNTANLLVFEPRDDITLLDVRGRLIARKGLTQARRVGVGELPPYVGNAFIAIEDRRFRSHFGVDPIGLARALVVDLRHGAFVQGGSTITQQLAKNLFLKPDRTLQRKYEEALLAFRLERNYSKDEILTLYLNRVYFGAGVYGIEAAAQRFFSKPARHLTVTEAAILAGSVKAPSRTNPATDIDAALSRAAIVLKAMERYGFIQEGELKDAIASRPKIAPSLATPGAGYFVEYAISLVPGFIGRAEEIDERLIVETTLDLDMQAAAEQALLSSLEKEGPALRSSQGAIVAMTPDGALRAIVGGLSYDESPFDRALHAYRQPGSSFKAFVYLAAMERGHRPYDLVFDGPVTLGNWAPENYEGKYAGEVTLSYALAHSSNSAAVQLANEVGPAQVARVAHRLGITAKLHEVPSLALGTSEVTPLELVTGYAAFANGGTAVISHAIVRVRTASGRVLYQRASSGAGRVMSAESNAELTEMMMRTVTEGTGRAASLGRRPVAGKTGTTQDYRDAWFVGFTADLVCGVWIGNDDNSPMNRATGGGLPARIFRSFMTNASQDLPERPLAGSEYLMAANTVTNHEPPREPAAFSEQEDGNILNAFQALLNKLF